MKYLYFFLSDKFIYKTVFLKFFAATAFYIESIYIYISS